jgi:hypothetical protein
MCFSPDGKTLVAGYGGADSHIKIFDLSAWQK